MCVLSIDTTFVTIGAAVVELYSFVFEFDENDTKKKKNKKNKNNQLPLLELLVAAKNKNLDKNALLSCSTMYVLSIDTFMTIGAAVVDFYSFV